MKAVVRIFGQRFSDFGCIEVVAWICVCYTLYYCGLAAMLVLEAQELIEMLLGLWVMLTWILKSIIGMGVLAAVAMHVSLIRYVWRKDYRMAKKGWSDATKYTDPESVLSYFGYRYYPPKSRTWLTCDPLGEDAGLNLHAFCKNNPLLNNNAYEDFKIGVIRPYLNRIEFSERRIGNGSWK